MKFNEAKKIVKDMQKASEVIQAMVTTMGIYAVNHYKKSFIDGGFTDESLEQWKPRKRIDRSRNSRAILTQTGRLRRSLVAKKLGRYSVSIQSNVKYANVHNEGLRAGRGKGFKMPKRQFVGYSGQLARKIEKKLDSNLRQIFK